MYGACDIQSAQKQKRCFKYNHDIDKWGVSPYNKHSY